jgi:iron complex outermembrane receptor protein
MRKLMYGGSFTALLIAAGLAAPGLAMAATSDVTATANATADGANTTVAGHVAALTATTDASASATTTTTATSTEVIVTGTRQVGVTAADSPAPVQVVGASQLVKTGAIDLASSLISDVPSLNIQANGGDMAGLSVQAALRGLSPNDTLVLVDGKRRHDSANLAVDSGSSFSGSATVDLSFIPVAAIDHVEVLTDGAAAQYGTDAIAGVVNVILKKGASAGTISATGGSYYSGQGETGQIAFNKGFDLGENGWLNVTLEDRYHNSSFAGIGDERLQSANGRQLPTCKGGATESSAFPPKCLQFPDTNVGKSKNFPIENQLAGDPEYNLYNAEYNMGYDFSPDLEIYSFGTAGYRLAEHYENYRPPDRVEGCTATTGAGGVIIPGTNIGGGVPDPVCGSGTLVLPFQQGFDPLEEIKELDGSFTGGVKGKLAGWNFDLATTYGEDHVGVYVQDSANNGLFSQLQSESPTQLQPQTSFYDGAFDDTQWTTTLDLDKSFDTGFLASPLNVAFGGEFRRETFTLSQGEPSSFVDGGVQSFFGYSNLDAGTFARTNYAVYVDLAADPIQNLHIDLAGRYEHYSDFGGAPVGKFTARYDFSPQFAIRGTVSNGFRAPTLQEEHYSGTNVSPTFAEAQLPPNSTAALDAGFQPLKPEKSVNYSVGFVAHPMDRMQITVDAYDIQLNNRIEVTNDFEGEVGDGAGVAVLDPAILNTIAARGVQIQSSLRSVGIATFTNAADTNTVGVDLTANYASDFDQYGHVDWTVGFNYSHTTFNKIDPIPAAATCDAAALAAFPTTCATLGQVPGGSLITPNAQSDLVDSTPEFKVILQGYWTLDKWSANLRGTLYGPESETTDAPGLNDGAGGSFIESIPTTFIVDLDVGYKVTSNIKLDMGANNLFNTFPPRAPVIGGQPADDGLVFNVPYAFAPWGINGGYYYGRVTISF